MPTPRSAGYGQFLFHDLGSSDAPSLIPPKTRVLIAGNRSGCGPSREAAVYTQVDFGIRAVVAPIFGDIFAANAVNFGLFPARVNPEDVPLLQVRLLADPAALGVVLVTQTTDADDMTVPFDIEPVGKLKLLNCWDDIDMTLTHDKAIAAFQTKYHNRSPWTVPDKAGS